MTPETTPAISNLSEIEQFASSAISEAIRRLLSEKHLYQSVSVDLAETADAIKEGDRRQAAMHGTNNQTTWIAASTSHGQPAMREATPRERAEILIDRRWSIPASRDWIGHSSTNTPFYFALKPIIAHCPGSNCGKSWAFNAAAESSYVETSNLEHDQQWFQLVYRCPHCSENSIHFLVRRNGRKLTLCGRDPFEEIEVPRYIPPDQAKFYKWAFVEYYSGQVLAAISLLRIFVEQFWRALPEVKALIATKPKPTGDEMGDAYNGTLEVVFKERTPNLRTIYDNLSEAIHLGKADEQIFDGAAEKICAHFEAKEMFARLAALHARKGESPGSG